MRKRITVIQGIVTTVAIVAAIISATGAAGTRRAADFNFGGLTSTRSQYFVMQHAVASDTDDHVYAPIAGFAKATSAKFFIRVASHVGSVEVIVASSPDGESFTPVCDHTMNANTTYECPLVGDNTAYLPGFMRVEVIPTTRATVGVSGFAYNQLASVGDLAGAGGGGATVQQETISDSTETTIVSGDAGYLHFSHLGGDSLLSYTDPFHPIVTADGLYSFTTYVTCRRDGGTTPGDGRGIWVQTAAPFQSMWMIWPSGTTGGGLTYGITTISDTVTGTGKKNSGDTFDVVVQNFTQTTIDCKIGYETVTRVS